MWYCYILRCIDDNHKNLTYNGSTNNMIKRLRQHNGILKGGAKATHGKQWEIYVIMTGFKTHKEALSCEWRIKHPTNSRKRPAKYCGVNGRVSGLNEVIVSDKWTSKCEADICDGQYDLYINKEVIDKLDNKLLPTNINLHEIEEITTEFLEKLESNQNS